MLSQGNSNFFWNGFYRNLSLIWCRCSVLSSHRLNLWSSRHRTACTPSDLQTFISECWTFSTWIAFRRVQVTPFSTILILRRLRDLYIFCGIGGGLYRGPFSIF